MKRKKYAPFLSMSLTHLSSAREQDFPQYLKLEKNITICTIIFDYKSLFVILFLAFKVRLIGLLSGVRQAAKYVVRTQR